MADECGTSGIKANGEKKSNANDTGTGPIGQGKVELEQDELQVDQEGDEELREEYKVCCGLCSVLFGLNFVGFGCKNEKCVLYVSYVWNRVGQLGGFSKLKEEYNAL